MACDILGVRLKAVSTPLQTAAHGLDLTLDVSPVATQRSCAATLKPVQLTPRASAIAVSANRLHHRVAALERYAYRDVQGTLGLPNNHLETRCFGLYAARCTARRVFCRAPRRPGCSPC